MPAPDWPAATGHVDEAQIRLRARGVRANKRIAWVAASKYVALFHRKLEHAVCL